ncbi:epidermal growth factor-like protein 7 isoform X2 [Lathamus discolor]|uniref:epidermal growth factor-like protein 7 isoform X2 n=1 Tax=Lathamus discolor TaxID=678569 RepID=UPI0032B785B1
MTSLWPLVRDHFTLGRGLCWDLPLLPLIPSPPKRAARGERSLVSTQCGAGRGCGAQPALRTPQVRLRISAGTGIPHKPHLQRDPAAAHGAQPQDVPSSARLPRGNPAVSLHVPPPGTELPGGPAASPAPCPPPGAGGGRRGRRGGGRRRLPGPRRFPPAGGSVFLPPELIGPGRRDRLGPGEETRGGRGAAATPAPGSPPADPTCGRSQRFPPEPDWGVRRSPERRGRAGTCPAAAASSSDSSSPSACPARPRWPGQAAGSVPRGHGAAPLPPPSPTCSPCTSPTSPPARATSAARTGPSTGLPTGRCTGSCPSPWLRAAPAGAGLMDTHSAAIELCARGRASTAAPAPSPTDASAPPAGRDEPARQTWMNAPGRAMGAANSASTQPGASTAPAGKASASLPTARAASPWCQRRSQEPSATQVPPVK